MWKKKEKVKERKRESEDSYYKRAVVGMHIRVGCKHLRWFKWEFLNLNENVEWKCESLEHVRLKVLPKSHRNCVKCIWNRILLINCEKIVKGRKRKRRFSSWYNLCWGSLAILV